MAGRLRFSVLLAALAAGAPVNPTGDCGVDNSTGAGGRSGYHSPAADDTYVADCTKPLKREYWRVFVQAGNGKAYVMPRPDGMGKKYGFCGDRDLDMLFKKYDMCVETVSDVHKINSMLLEDALKITRALHRKLVFVAAQGKIDPWAPPNDVTAACDEGLTMDKAALGHCQSLNTLYDKDMAVVPSAAAVKALVPALNTLYGISGSSQAAIAKAASCTSIGLAVLIAMVASLL